MKVDKIKIYKVKLDTTRNGKIVMPAGDYVLYSDVKAIEEERDKYYKKACAWQSNCEERDRQIATLTAETIQWKAAWQTEADGLKHADAEIERLERDKAILEGVRSGLRADIATPEGALGKILHLFPPRGTFSNLEMEIIKIAQAAPTSDK